CHPAGPVDTRLRGILFEGSSGSITHSTVTGVNQGASGCQEGNAIEVRNAPFDGTHPNTQTVTIEHNGVFNYQKAGILANGDVAVTIRHNTVGVSATQANLTANSVQLGFEAQGSVTHNQIDGNSWCCASAAATAILIFDAHGVNVSQNNVGGNADVGIYILADNVTVNNNRVFEAGPDGFYDIGIGNYGNNNAVTNNKVRGYDTAYDGVTGGKNKTIPGSQQGDPAF
nr:right-handed parallel beta-helix repeat-containing protein [Chloroflexia bacterium]